MQGPSSCCQIWPVVRQIATIWKGNFRCYQWGHMSICPPTPRQTAKGTQFLQQVLQGNTKAPAKPTGSGWFIFFDCGFLGGLGLGFFNNLSKIITCMTEWCLASYARSPRGRHCNQILSDSIRADEPAYCTYCKGKPLIKMPDLGDKVVEIHSGGQSSTYTDS